MPVLDDRFWSKVNKTETCWLWTASCRTGGYGQFGIKGKYYGAHRLSWEVVHGPIPVDRILDHTCHVRTCVNPDHLRLVTQKTNGENRSGAPKQSRTGVRGVGIHQGRYRVMVKHNGQTIYGGQFSILEEAAAVAVALRNELFTHNDLDRKPA